MVSIQIQSDSIDRSIQAGSSYSYFHERSLLLPIGVEAKCMNLILWQIEAAVVRLGLVLRGIAALFAAIAIRSPKWRTDSCRKNESAPTLI